MLMFIYIHVSPFYFGKYYIVIYYILHRTLVLFEQSDFIDWEIFYYLWYLTGIYFFLYLIHVARRKETTTVYKRGRDRGHIQKRLLFLLLLDILAVVLGLNNCRINTMYVHCREI